MYDDLLCWIKKSLYQWGIKGDCLTYKVTFLSIDCNTNKVTHTRQFETLSHLLDWYQTGINGINFAYD